MKSPSAPQVVDEDEENLLLINIVDEETDYVEQDGVYDHASK